MSSYRFSIAFALVVVVSGSVPAGIAYAREDGHIGREPEHGWGAHPAWRGGYGERLRGPEHERWRGPELERWHGGHWFQGEHSGRLGWWWVAGDGWYYYPAPVYPYPDPYVPPAVTAPSAGYAYYCPSAAAYYPSVTECGEAWQPVVPQAPGS